MQTFIPGRHPSLQLNTGASLTKKEEGTAPEVGDWPFLPCENYFINPHNNPKGTTIISILQMRKQAQRFLTRSHTQNPKLSSH